MNARRSFFKNLIGVSAVAAATASTALAKPEPVREIPRQKHWTHTALTTRAGLFAGPGTKKTWGAK